MERILIFAPNWLGDAVMALPAIADVRRAFPDATLTIAARPAVAPLFELVPGIDATCVMAAANQRRADRAPRSLSTETDRPRHDVALLLTNSFRTALLARRTGIPERWGYRGDWRRFLLTRAIRRPKRGHQVAYYQHLVAELDIMNGPSTPSIDVAPTAIDRGAERLREAGWDGRSPLVALAPGAAYGSAKRWPPSYFGELTRAFRADGIGTVLVGSAADAPTGREVEIAAGPGIVLNVIGQTTLVELVGVLRNCRAAVSNDSGAMHLAAAAGVPVTAMFGPTRERETAPRQGVSVLTNQIWCRPCMLRECPLDHACMRGISVARVREATSVISHQSPVVSRQSTDASQQSSVIGHRSAAGIQPPSVAVSGSRRVAKR